MLFFGTVKINGYTEVMTVSLINMEGKTIYTIIFPLFLRIVSLLREYTLLIF